MLFPEFNEIPTIVRGLTRKYVLEMIFFLSYSINEKSRRSQDGVSYFWWPSTLLRRQLGIPNQRSKIAHRNLTNLVRLGILRKDSISNLEYSYDTESTIIAGGFRIAPPKEREVTKQELNIYKLNHDRIIIQLHSRNNTELLVHRSDFTTVTDFVAKMVAIIKPLRWKSTNDAIRCILSTDEEKTVMAKRELDRIVRQSGGSIINSSHNHDLNESGILHLNYGEDRRLYVDLGYSSIIIDLSGYHAPDQIEVMYPNKKHQSRFYDGVVVESNYQV